MSDSIIIVVGNPTDAATLAIRSVVRDHPRFVILDDAAFIQQQSSSGEIEMHRPPLEQKRSAAMQIIASIGASLFGSMIAERLADDPYGTSHRRQRRHLVNYTNFQRNREKRRSIYQAISAYQLAVNQLTNHERNLWARAGYPGHKGNNVDQVLAFSVKHTMAEIRERR